MINLILCLLGLALGFYCSRHFSEFIKFFPRSLVVRSIKKLLN